MGDTTKIQWTDHTFNPWWGCTRVSPGCEHCYAETFAKRTGLGWGVGAERRFFTDKHWREPVKWNAAAEKAGERRRVFCASMADVFEARPELVSWRLRLFDLIRDTPWLDWQLLTKRPENVRALTPWGDDWPRNVWMGATAEDQKRADERIPALLDTPAAVRFLSCEPLLGPVDMDHNVRFLTGTAHPLSRIRWVIVGGESGRRARPFELAWARRIVRQCQRAGVAVFVKQLGACAADPVNGVAGASLRVPQVAEGLISLRLRHAKGGDPAEWPEDLRVREFPEALP